MRDTMANLASIVGQIQASGHRLSGSAGTFLTANAALVANCDETAGKAASVSAASEQMIASIEDISRNTTEAAAVARTAVDTADEAGRVIATLSEASSGISDVVELIQAIASQTNLLALNATIEAARAGQAGKGFAVVAEEVKRLSQQTAQATATITSRVDNIETGAAAAARSVTQIGDVVRRINEIAITIAGAVEEQTATTSEISRNVSAVAGAAGATAEVTTESAQSARALTTMADDLRSAVSHFTVDKH